MKQAFSVEELSQSLEEIKEIEIFYRRKLCKRRSC